MGWLLFFRQSQTSQLNKGHNEQLYNGNADLRTVTVKTALPETSIRTKDLLAIKLLEIQAQHNMLLKTEVLSSLTFFTCTS